MTPWFAAPEKGGPVFRTRNLILVLLGYTLGYLAARWYQGTYGWAAGLDAYAPEFEIYWMRLLYSELALEALVAALLWGWLWRTRDRYLEAWWRRLRLKDLALEKGKSLAGLEPVFEPEEMTGFPLTPREELRRNLTHLIWLAAYAWSVYWGMSFFTEQDATWHQTVIRDTDFTPSHIIVFYLSYPVFIITGMGSFLYARTRVPFFPKAFPFLI